MSPGNTGILEKAIREVVNKNDKIARRIAIDLLQPQKRTPPYDPERNKIIRYRKEMKRLMDEIARLEEKVRDLEDLVHHLDGIGLHSLEIIQRLKRKRDDSVIQNPCRRYLSG